MNKIKISIAISFILAVFVIAAHFGEKKPEAQMEESPRPTSVSVQLAKDSGSVSETASYPASIVGDQEIKVTAKSSGSISSAPFELGNFVAQGSLLAKIDDTGKNLAASGSGFQSSQVQLSELSQEQAKKALDAAKKYYKDLKKAYDDSDGSSPTKAQLNSAEKAIDIAEIQYNSAVVGLKGTLDSRLITSPISGFVTSKNVSVGDYVSLGQEIATVSKTKNVKVNFFIDQNQLPSVSKGMDVTIENGSGDRSVAVVRNISPVADEATKKFLVEAFPKDEISSAFPSGTIATVSFEVKRGASQEGSIMLPLSAITVGQNQSHIFIDDSGHAKKVDVSIVTVTGEFAEVRADLGEDARIIINGSKMVRDGDRITIQN